VVGGAPGSRETDLLAPEMAADGVDAFVLSGGSAFGLDAAAGVAERLRAEGRGVEIGPHVIPIVPAAIVFDLDAARGETWDEGPWRRLGVEALALANDRVALGSVGAGTGATTATLKGGVGSASAVVDGITVGAFVVANPIGSVTVGNGRHFWAAPFEEGQEFGGFGPAMAPEDRPPTKTEARAGAATVIGLVATDLALTKPQAKRLAMMAHDGIARAVVPAHTPFDGDLVFAASTGVRHAGDPDIALIGVGHAAATCLARSIARAVYLAEPRPGDTHPAWREKFGSA
ncbi:MAG: P1 family peptidase, partial [Pseudomonadota bacterium]